MVVSFYEQDLLVVGVVVLIVILETIKEVILGNMGIMDIWQDDDIYQHYSLRHVPHEPNDD